MPRNIANASQAVACAAAEVQKTAHTLGQVSERLNRLVYDLRKQGHIDVETHVLGKDIATTRIVLPPI